MSIEQRVEGMEKFLLGALLAAEKLDVINQEQISLAVTFPELHEIAVLNGVDEFIDEQLAGKVNHFRVFLPPAADMLADRLHQMGFAQPDAAINEKRIKCAGGR